jgi:hypothetical protein
MKGVTSLPSTLPAPLENTLQQRPQCTATKLYVHCIRMHEKHVFSVFEAETIIKTATPFYKLYLLGG